MLFSALCDRSDMAIYNFHLAIQTVFLWYNNECILICYLSKIWGLLLGYSYRLLILYMYFYTSKQITCFDISSVWLSLSGLITTRFFTPFECTSIIVTMSYVHYICASSTQCKTEICFYIPSFLYHYRIHLQQLALSHQSLQSDWLTLSWHGDLYHSSPS